MLADFTILTEKQRNNNKKITTGPPTFVQKSPHSDRRYGPHLFAELLDKFCSQQEL
jgi:hypothetical protein